MAPQSLFPEQSQELSHTFYPSVSNEVVFKHPLFLELAEALDAKMGLNVQIPYVLKDVILMSPGKWNGFGYKIAALQSAFSNTDWTQRDIRALYLDHKDNEVPNWVGEIRNEHQDGSNLRGDLYIYDPITAIKLAYGKPRFGISPKVVGTEKEGEILDFVYQNFSIVITPACKTTYLNSEKKFSDGVYVDHGVVELENEEILEEVTAMEAKRKAMGMSPGEFYACPKEPPSESKLPIFDAAHVRNALARFNQVQGLSPEEKASAHRKIVAAAKKFGINVAEKMEEVKMGEQEPVKESAVQAPTVPAEVNLSAKMDAILQQMTAINALLSELCKPKVPAKMEEAPKEESKEMTEVKKTVSELSEKVKGLSGEDKPDKLNVRGFELADRSATSADEAMADFIRRGI